MDNRGVRAKRTVSLSWKLTLSFVVFGLVIAYAAFVFFSAAVLRNTLRGASELLRLSMKNQNERSALLEDPQKWVASLKNTLSPLFPVEEVRLYQIRADSRWEYLSSTDRGLVRPEDTKTLAALRQAGSQLTLVHGLPVFSGTLRIPAYIRLPDTPWVLEVTVDVEGPERFLLRYGNEVLLYTLLLCALSLLLGRFLALHFIRPLRALTTTAERYAAGKEVSFIRDRRDEIGILSRTLNQMALDMEEQKRQVHNRLATMEAMNKIDKTVLLARGRSELLMAVIHEVHGSCHSHGAALLRRDSAQGGWIVEALTGSSSAEGAFISDALIDDETTVNLSRFYEGSLGGAGKSFRGIALDVLEMEGGHLASVPLSSDGRYLGALVIVWSEDRPLDNLQKQSVQMLADQVAVALQSILTREEKEENFIGILRALTRAIDAKSQWTLGHSERVADTAILLGQRLLMEEEELRLLRIAAILHDVGKIGINETILDKPGKLEPLEYETMRKHPQVGAEILQGIRSFEPIVPAVRSHHERWDGQGYPEGLAGEAIPLWARIIAVADVWDAITDDRPYRLAFEESEALAFMEQQGGRMFDPRLIRIFRELGLRSRSASKVSLPPP